MPLPPNSAGVVSLDLRKSEATVRGRLVRAASSPALVGTPRPTSSDMLVLALSSDGSRLVRSTSIALYNAASSFHGPSSPYFTNNWLACFTSQPKPPLAGAADMSGGGRVQWQLVQPRCCPHQTDLTPRHSKPVHLLPSGLKECAIAAMRRGDGHPSAETH
jgi:hypothetical protein